MIKLKENKLAIILSVGLHVIIFCFLFMKLPHSKNKPDNNVKIIQAVTINEQALTKENPTPKSTVPTLSENTIRKIEQTALKQTEVTKIPIAKPISEPEPQTPVEPPLPVKPEPQPLKPVVLQQPKPPQVIEKKETKVVEKNQEKELQKVKHQEALQTKKRQAEAAAELQKELEAEAKESKEKEDEDQDQVAAIEDNNQKDSEAEGKGEAEQTKTASNSPSNGELDKYKNLIIQSISRKWILPENVENNLSCQLLVHLGPGGVVLSVDIVKESGDGNLDRSARNAIMKASPLPVPESLDLFDNFRALRLTFRPEGIVSG